MENIKKKMKGEQYVLKSTSENSSYPEKVESYEKMEEDENSENLWKQKVSHVLDNVETKLQR